VFPNIFTQQIKNFFDFPKLVLRPPTYFVPSFFLSNPLTLLAATYFAPSYKTEQLNHLHNKMQSNLSQTLCVCLSLHSVCLYVCIFICLSVPNLLDSTSLSHNLSVFILFSQSHLVSSSICLFMSLSFSLSLSIYLSHCVSVRFHFLVYSCLSFLSVPSSVLLSVDMSLSITLTVILFLFLCVSVSQFF